MKKTTQALTIVFALAMLAAYVVYSQAQQNRTVAPSSKVIALPEAKAWHSATNNPRTQTASSSSRGAASNAPISTTVPTSMIAPGSKSAAVFSPRSTPSVTKEAKTISTNPVSATSFASSTIVTNSGTNRLPARPIRSKP